MLEHLKTLVAAETARTGRRRTIHLTDDTLRDGQQCLWATRMRTEHMLPIAERMDRAGFLSLQAIALVQFDASVLFLNQNPFERIRLLAGRITRTPMRAAIRSNLMRGFFPVADDVTELFVERQIANGVREIGLFDALMCNDNLASSIAAAHRLGAAVTLLLGYNIAPGYDDALYAAKAREAVERFGVQTVALADAAGILTLERVRTLVPAIKQAIGDRARLEFNTHCLTGLGPLLAIEAAVHGADTILTAVDPLANGNSLPASQMIARNLREIGFDVRVDDGVLDEVGAYFSALAEREGQPVGVPAEYEPSHYVTQYAGGAMSNLESQLKLAGLSDKLPAVLEEIGRVRVELGSPIMVTPYPAIVSAQAVMNVLNVERYKVVPDEVKKYVCGYFGDLPLPVDANVKDRIIANGSRDVALEPPMIEPVLPGLRQRYGNLGDDELLLRYMYGDEKVDALKPTPVDDSYSLHHPVVDLAAGLAARARKAQVQVAGDGFSMNAG
ncbi:carboxylase [Variovorax sp. J22P168]|uniref:carboxylase n=1 Tax=Variovorax jilinensis TaxID=3053513 RepID=UPI0025770B82|nr:carboxylase [Variovorax sp. J22P168]MDM0015795.1 carboxylase [Variovorax sp. J22P168]